MASAVGEMAPVSDWNFVGIDSSPLTLLAGAMSDAMHGQGVRIPKYESMLLQSKRRATHEAVVRSLSSMTAAWPT